MCFNSTINTSLFLQVQFGFLLSIIHPGYLCFLFLLLFFVCLNSTINTSFLFSSSVLITTFHYLSWLSSSPVSTSFLGAFKLYYKHQSFFFLFSSSVLIPHSPLFILVTLLSLCVRLSSTSCNTTPLHTRPAVSHVFHFLHISFKTFINNFCPRLLSHTSSLALIFFLAGRYVTQQRGRGAFFPEAWGVNSGPRNQLMRQECKTGIVAPQEAEERRKMGCTEEPPWT